MGLETLRRKLLGTALVAVIAALTCTSMANAASHHPTGEFAPFGECPLSRPTITDCIYSVTTSGSFTIGNRTVPIVNPVTVQGGFEGEGANIQFFGAENGKTLSKTPQPIPGGLLGGAKAPPHLPKLLKLLDAKLSAGLRATVELAAPATQIKLNTENLIFEEGIALQLPVKIHLEGSFLGSNCYLGSNSHPITLAFTTGSSGKLKGAAGQFTFNEEFTLLTLSDSKLVDNVFTVPGATGCGGAFGYLVNPLVNLILGAPAPSGGSSAILEGQLQDASSAAVRDSE